MRRLPISLLLAAALVAVAALPAAAKPKPSCLRGGATLQDASGSVRVVALKARKGSANETRHVRLLACWAPTGRRTAVADLVDLGDDNRASARVEVVDGRYVGVTETNEGGVSISVAARTYDARKGKLLHDSSVCDDSQGDFSGPEDVAFLDEGGLALACRKLVVYRKAGSAAELLEPEGAWVRQVAVSRHADGFGQRLFWIVGDGTNDVTKSAAL